MIIRQQIKLNVDYSGVTPESFYEFIKDINSNRERFKIKAMFITLFQSKKDNSIIHAVLEINTELQRLFTFQYALLKLYAAPTATLQAVDKIFGPQIESWSRGPDLRYNDLNRNKQSVNKVIWTINSEYGLNEEITCFEGIYAGVGTNKAIKTSLTLKDLITFIKENDVSN